MAVAAALAMLALAGALAIFVPPTATDERGAPAIARLLDAWTAKLSGTYTVELHVSRQQPGGGSFDVDEVLVQRPPDRLLSGLGTVNGRFEGRLVRCRTSTEGVESCAPTASARSYAADVAAELDTLRSYVEGPRPLYRTVGYGRGCFGLELALALPAPPYGQEALFCFDEVTGAPRLTVIRRDGLIERVEATRISTEVTFGDLRSLAAGEPYVVRGR